MLKRSFYIMLMALVGIMYTNLHAQDALERGNPFKDVFRGKPWEFMEYQFVIKPARELQSWSHWAKKWTAASAAGALGKMQSGPIYDWVAKKYYYKKVSNQPDISKLSTAIVATIVPMFIVNKLINHYTEQHLDFKGLKQFLAEWDENKEYIPDDLQETFDGLYEIYEYKDGKEMLEEMGPEMINLIKKSIYEHFPKKYEVRLKYEDEKFWDSKFMQVLVKLDIAEVVKGVAHIMNIYLNPTKKKAMPTTSIREV